MLNRFFQLEKHGANVRTEVLAGLTTFFTMAYILFVNPSMLAEGAAIVGGDGAKVLNGVFFATALASFVGTLLMAVHAKIPFAQAPGMGLNAFFTYTVMATYGYMYDQALGIVFISGLLFIVITVTGLRGMIVEAIPKNIKISISAGIGLFLAFLGLQNSGLVVDNGATLVSLVNFTGVSNPETRGAVMGAVLTVIGLVIIATLSALKVRGALLIGIVGATLIGIPMGVTVIPQSFTINFAGQFADFTEVSLFAFWPGLVSLFSGGSFAQSLFTLDTKSEYLTFESQTISVADAERKIADLRKDLGKSELLSPVSGVITAMNLDENMTTKTGETVAATIQDIYSLQTIINVDELDITKIELGQKVTLTLEALEDNTYYGTVSKIGMIGTVSNNFATFPVTIDIENPGEIMIGMSCEATVEIVNARNTLVLPVDMLQRGRDGYSVLVVTGGMQEPAEPEGEGGEAPQQQGGGMPGGGMPMGGMMMGNFGGAQQTGSAANLGVQTETRQVTVGLMNEDYAQILSGIEEGDWIASLVESTSMFQMMMTGGMAGGQGGPPAGR